MKKKKAALEAERKAREKEAADKAPAGKGKKDAKKAGKKKWFHLYKLLFLLFFFIFKFYFLINNQSKYIFLNFKSFLIETIYDLKIHGLTVKINIF